MVKGAGMGAATTHHGMTNKANSVKYSYVDITRVSWPNCRGPGAAAAGMIKKARMLKEMMGTLALPGGREENRKKTKLQQKVTSFYLRDDISYVSPIKRDVVKTKEGPQPRRY